MAVDMFLKIGDIEGEAKDKGGHEKEIQILSYQYGAKQSATTQEGGGGGSGAAEVDDLIITKYVDKSSPTLFFYCCMGTEIESARLTIRKAGGSAPLEYLKVDLAGVIISSVTNGGLANSNDQIQETIKLNFEKICVTYTPQDTAGSGVGDVFGPYDISGNAEWTEHPS